MPIYSLPFLCATFFPPFIFPDLFISTFLPEYGPRRLPVSLVCRRLQRLLLLADPPGQGQRSASRASDSRAQGPDAQTHPPAGYTPCSLASHELCPAAAPFHLTFYTSASFLFSNGSGLLPNYRILKHYFYSIKLYCIHIQSHYKRCDHGYDIHYAVDPLILYWSVLVLFLQVVVVMLLLFFFFFA